MEQFYNFLKEFAKDNDMRIETGWKEKNRRSEMLEAFEIIKKSGDPRKKLIAIQVETNYKLLDDLMNKMVEVSDFDEFGKSFVRGVYDRMCSGLDTYKRCLTGSLLALAFAKDERIRDFYLEILCEAGEDYQQQKEMIDEVCKVQKECLDEEENKAQKECLDEKC